MKYIAFIAASYFSVTFLLDYVKTTDNVINKNFTAYTEVKDYGLK